MSAIIFDKTTKCKKGGYFVKIKKSNGSDIIIESGINPALTYGVNNFANFNIYFDKRELDTAAIKSIEQYADIEKEIFKLAQEKFNVTTTRSRLSDTTYNDVCKLVVKKTPMPKSLIRDLTGRELSIEKIKERSHMYCVLKLDSIYISASTGIVPQLKIEEAVFVKYPKAPKYDPIDMKCILRKYESMSIKNLTWNEHDDNKIEE